MPLLERVAYSVIAALAASFAVGIVRTADPARKEGTLHPTDTRQGHVGSLSYGESERLMERLRHQRAAEANPEARAVYSAQLADGLVQKQQYVQAMVELGEALRLFPERPELLARAALIHLALGERARAQAVLQEARRRAPDLPLVRTAAAVIEGESVPGP
jgi:tetratricopeptide (TPR) repeat protein